MNTITVNFTKAGIKVTYTQWRYMYISHNNDFLQKKKKNCRLHNTFTVDQYIINLAQNQNSRFMQECTTARYIDRSVLPITPTLTVISNCEYKPDQKPNWLLSNEYRRAFSNVSPSRTFSSSWGTVFTISYSLR